MTTTTTLTATTAGAGARAPSAVRIAGYGEHLPGEALDNDAVASMFGPLPGELYGEIGVTTRHWLARPGVDEHPTSTSAMGAAAARDALAQAGVAPREVDLLVLSTSSPEYHLPGAATYVLEHLGALRAATIELRAGCTGFPVALDVARAQLAMGRARTAVVLGVEAVSPALMGMLHATAGEPRRMRLRDRLAAFTFGDGAAAVVLRRDETGQGTVPVTDPGYAFVQGTLDASLPPGIRIVGGGTALPVHRQAADGLLKVELDAHGSERNGPRVLGACLEHLRRAADRGVADVDHLVLPEGDAAYFAQQVTDDLVGGDSTRYGATVRQNLDDVGATGSPAVPLALGEALREGAVADGDTVLLVGIEGARYQYAANLLTWPHL